MNIDSSALILLIGLTTWTVISFNGRNPLMVPAALHNGAWIVALAIVASGLMNYRQISSYAWVLIATSIFAFNLGVATSARPGSAHKTSSPKHFVTMRQFWILNFGFGAGFAIYLYSISTSFGLGTLVSDPTSIRGYSTISYLEAFPIYGKVLFYLGPLCFILAAFPEYVEGLRGHSWRLPLLIAVAGAQVATLQRTNIFVCLVWAIGLLLLRSTPSSEERARGRGRRIVALTISMAVGLAAFQGLALALGKTGNTNASINSVVDERLQGSSFTSVFHYASSGVPAFGNLVESDNRSWPPSAASGPIYGDYNPQTWGRATFSAPLKAVPGMSPWEEVAPFTSLPVPTNVYTWLEPWYRDFRMPGVLGGSLAIGLLVGYLTRRRGERPEIMLLAGLIIGLSGLATFVNRLSAVMTIVLYLAIWFLSRSSVKRVKISPHPG